MSPRYDMDFDPGDYADPGVADDDAAYTPNSPLFPSGDSFRHRAFREPPDSLFVRIETTLCGLAWAEPYWTGAPERPFRPLGLVVPNAPPGARLVEWMVGREIALPVGREPIALSTFAHLEELEARTRKRPTSSPSFPTCGPSVSMRLRITDSAGTPLGPPLEPTVWGHAPRNF